jgi:hypothetical protein
MMETTGPRRSGVFLSYSHVDVKWLDRPKVFFENLRNRGWAEAWTDHQIRPGADWDAEIQKALDAAAVAILLISENFLVSEFIGRVELPRILEAREARGLVVLSVYLSPSTIGDYPELAGIQALNGPEKFLCDMTPGEQEALWVKMYEEIKRAIGTARARSAAASGRDDGRAVYLAPAATAALSEFRDEVEDYLALQLPGVRVLPESDDPGGTVEVFSSAVRADLGRSALFVQLLDMNRGLDRFDDAADEGFVALLHRLALEQKAPRKILQWRDAARPLLGPADSPHRRLLEGPTVRTAGREEFKRIIVERYVELTERTEPLGDGKKRIFIDAEPTAAWRSVADRIEEELTQRRGIACMLLGEADQTLEKRREIRDYCLTQCDGLLFVGGSNPGWLPEEHEAYLKLKLKRKEAGKRLAIPMALCEGPPKSGPCAGPVVPCFWCDPDARRGASVAVRHRLPEPEFEVIDCSTVVRAEASGDACAEAFDRFVGRVRGDGGAQPSPPRGGLRT